VDETVQVPREYVKNNEIVLNISFDATSSLNLGNEFIEFKARFAGSAREIVVPISRVIAIYARENGQGMAFPAPAVSSAGPIDSPSVQASGDDEMLPHGDSGEAPAKTGFSAKPAEKVEAMGSTGAPKLFQLVPESGLTAGDEGEIFPEPPKTPAGSRPTLKRIK
jgi:stringent starvation protein B